jgi:hypothetical protein
VYKKFYSIDAFCCKKYIVLKYMHKDDQPWRITTTMDVLGYAAPSAKADLDFYHFERRDPRTDDVSVI